MQFMEGDGVHYLEKCLMKECTLLAGIEFNKLQDFTSKRTLGERGREKVSKGGGECITVMIVISDLVSLIVLSSF